MSLSDEAKAKRDEEAIYYKGNIVRAGHISTVAQLIVEQAFKDGFGVGVEFERARSQQIARDSVTLIEAEKARSQKLVEDYTNKFREIITSWNEFGPEVMDELLHRVERWLEAHKAGE